MALITHGEWLDRFGDDAEAHDTGANDLVDSMSFTATSAPESRYGSAQRLDGLPPVWGMRLTGFARPARLS